ncbi:hypothetical protein BH11MYX4_BH11MYX4_63800 [soil metagenome]
MRTQFPITAFVALLAFGCSAEDGNQLGSSGNPTAPGDPPTTPPGTTPPGTIDPATCGGKDFASFDGKSLIADRAVANVGVDRGRFKPYDALAAEYKRVLGSTPASLAAAADTFGKSDPRWYDEPLAGGVVLQTSYSIAFDGCLTYTASAADFAAAPTAATAATKCAEMARTFWSRTASPDQTAACVDVAVTGAATVTDPRKRWAYACASVLSSAGFLTY